METTKAKMPIVTSGTGSLGGNAKSILGGSKKFLHYSNRLHLDTIGIGEPDTARIIILVDACDNTVRDFTLQVHFAALTIRII